MLFEMASGNLSYRLELFANDEKLNEIISLLNTAAGKLELLLAKHESANSNQNSAGVNLLQKQSKAALIQNIHNYILNNLHEPLPTLKELSHIFNTNQYKLKEDFKSFFNTSIHHYYNNQRLKKAYILIKETDSSLKEIAYMCGFNSYTNFAKAFKKKYQSAPGQINRTLKFE